MKERMVTSIFWSKLEIESGRTTKELFFSVLAMYSLRVIAFISWLQGSSLGSLRRLHQRPSRKLAKLSHSSSLESLQTSLRSSHYHQTRQQYSPHYYRAL